MFEAGTLGGPIGIDEVSKDFAFILDRVTRRRSRTTPWGFGQPKLSDLLRVEPITRKYMFETTNAFMRRMIARYAAQCPPKALRYAMSCHPPDRRIAQVALANFKDVMEGYDNELFFTCDSAKYAYKYSPAAHNLRSRFIKEHLGTDGYLAYVVALHQGRLTDTSWDWKKVAQAFVDQLGLPPIDILDC
jgi:hypothetical protein